ncbi:MAG: transcriptional regulator NrdR [Ruminococcus sp.]|nr:transcriptional regulator NrdR [Ruminococcus sp.]
MKCPFCGNPDTKVVDSRSGEDRKKRRRECNDCGKRFTTYETYDVSDAPTLLVMKKDGSVELFNRTKIIAGISSAVKKRPVSAERIQKIVESIENAYAVRESAREKPIFTTTEIGDMVLSQLKECDVVAYIRFASVYKDFDNADSFIRIINDEFKSQM